MSLILIVLLLIPISSSANPDNSDDWDEDPEEAPADGGISLLVAAGAIYGARKARQWKTGKERGKAKQE